MARVVTGLMYACVKCGKPLGRMQAGRLKIFIKSRTLAVRPDGGVEIKCHHCNESTDLPFSITDSLTLSSVVK